ncbi:hypothetical protein LINPERPRIM_LOCUS11732 [Linum perenne]
MVLGLPEG